MNNKSSSDKSLLAYEKMVQSALLTVVRDCLSQVSQYGLPNNHHFYIGFRTDHPMVKMASYLKEFHPKEITIVLQYQFWDLKVYEDRFCVSLSFNDKTEHIEIPFKSITSFVDPAVRFGLQFTPEISEVNDEDEENPSTDSDKTDDKGNSDNVVKVDFRKNR